MSYSALPREEIRAAIAREAEPSRVPVAIHFWVHPHEFGDREAEVKALLAQYPEDIRIIDLRMPAIYAGAPDDPSYRWVNLDAPPGTEHAALDARAPITDWAQLDGILDDFPSPDFRGLIPHVGGDDGRYRIGKWWFCLFERHWMLRGMTHALMDYFDAPEAVHRLFRALTNFYKRAMERARREMGCDAILVGDDLGTQTGSFFSMDVFDTFYRPYYTEMIDTAHELGMHFWLHCCGDVTLLLPELIDMGLDVIHPVQKHAMDQAAAAEQFRDRISFWVGLDVQQVIPWGSPDGVRREVRLLADAFTIPDRGGMVLTAGNGINGDCPLPSLEAFLNEAFRYSPSAATAE